MCKVIGERGGMLLSAIRHGDTERAVDLLLTRRWESWELSGQEGEGDGTPLYHAAARGESILVDLLLTFGALVNVRTVWGANPLHAAADRNRVPIVKTLLLWGCDRSTRTESGDSPAHIAAYRGHVEIVRLLLEDGYNSNLKNNRGNSLLEEAFSNPNNSHSVRRDLSELVKIYSKTRSPTSSRKDKTGSYHSSTDTRLCDQQEEGHSPS